MLPGRQAYPTRGGSASQLVGPPQGREHPLKQPVRQLRRGIEPRLPTDTKIANIQQDNGHYRRGKNLRAVHQLRRPA